LIFDGFLEAVKVHVHTKLHQVKYSGSLDGATLLLCPRKRLRLPAGST